VGSLGVVCGGAGGKRLARVKPRPIASLSGNASAGQTGRLPQIRPAGQLPGRPPWARPNRTAFMAGLGNACSSIERARL